MTPPEHLQSGGESRLLTQKRWVADLEEARRALVQEYGGFGIPNDLAYAHADATAWNPDMTEQQRQQVLAELEAARTPITLGNAKGGKRIRQAAEARMQQALERHRAFIADLRGRGHGVTSVARRLAELENISQSTAQRWLKKI